MEVEISQGCRVLNVLALKYDQIGFWFWPCDDVRELGQGGSRLAKLNLFVRKTQFLLDRDPIKFTLDLAQKCHQPVGRHR